MARELSDEQHRAVATVALIRRRVLALQAHLEEMRELEVAAVTRAVAANVPQTALVEATDLSKGRISQMASQGSGQPREHRGALLKQWEDQWEEWVGDRISDLERGARSCSGDTAAE